MKIRFLTLIASTICAVSLSSCASTNNSSQGVIPEGKYEEFDFRGQGYVDRDYCAAKTLVYNVGVGGSKTIQMESFPTSYALDNLSFSSNDESIATVDASGIITGVSNGITDIIISSKEGEFLGKVRACVSYKNSSKASSIISSLTEAYKEAAKPTRVKRYEYSYETYSCEGVFDHGVYNSEVTIYDAEEGYFSIEGPSIYYKTAHGHPEVKDGKWVMYTMNQGLMTRLVHITPTAKNYFDINTASYSSMDRIIRDILNFFFTNGEEIIDDLLDDYHGEETLNSTKSGTPYVVGENSIYIEDSGTGRQTISASFELNGVEIPTGTVCDLYIEENGLFNGTRATGLYYDAELAYVKEDKNWSRSFVKSSVFDSDFELERYDDAKDMGFKEVDSLYDL